jgi:hypothetical protein
MPWSRWMLMTMSQGMEGQSSIFQKNEFSFFRVLLTYFLNIWYEQDWGYWWLCITWIRRVFLLPLKSSKCIPLSALIFSFRRTMTWSNLTLLLELFGDKYCGLLPAVRECVAGAKSRLLTSILSAHSISAILMNEVMCLSVNMVLKFCLFVFQSVTSIRSA